MRKNILILAASPRKGGNSDLLCDAFTQGAKEAGHAVEKIYVHDQKISGCMACYGCRGKGVCVQQDDMAPILDKLVAADVIVLATPVYFYAMDGQLKTLIDRTLPRPPQSPPRRLHPRPKAGAARSPGVIWRCP